MTDAASTRYTQPSARYTQPSPRYTQPSTRYTQTLAAPRATLDALSHDPLVCVAPPPPTCNTPDYSPRHRSHAGQDAFAHHGSAQVRRQGSGGSASPAAARMRADALATSATWASS